MSSSRETELFAEKEAVVGGEILEDGDAEQLAQDEEPLKEELGDVDVQQEQQVLIQRHTGA